MAHEIAHVTARHALRRAEEAEKRSDVISKAAARASTNRDEEPHVPGAMPRLSLASFSRQQEIRGGRDRRPCRSPARASIPTAPRGFLQLLGRSVRVAAGRCWGATPRPKNLTSLSTHPSTPERIARAVARVARQIGAPGLGEVGRDRYLAAIDGIEPSETIRPKGFVRGRVASCTPSSAFTFTAPPNFALENSAQAVLGIANGGSGSPAPRSRPRRLPRHDARSLSSRPVGSTACSLGSVENSLVVNGLSGRATATAKGDEWYLSGSQPSASGQRRLSHDLRDQEAFTER